MEGEKKIMATILVTGEQEILAVRWYNSFLHTGIRSHLSPGGSVFPVPA
jgi:hypothetical protein